MVAFGRYMMITGALALAGVFLLAPGALAKNPGSIKVGQGDGLDGGTAGKNPVCRECEKQRRMHPGRYPRVVKSGKPGPPQKARGNTYGNPGPSQKNRGNRYGETQPPKKAAGHEKLKHRPPPWAPAHGRRAKHMYRYYPRSRVYYDPGRSLWFWLAGTGWRSGPALPGSIRLDAIGMVKLGMDADKPHGWHNDVSKYFPPPR